MWDTVKTVLRGRFIGEGNGISTCLENPRDGGALVGCRLWSHTESDTTEVTQQQQQQHRFWVVVFSFSFISMQILISFLISSVIFLVIQQRVVQPPYVGIFNSFSPVIEI